MPNFSAGGIFRKSSYKKFLVDLKCGGRFGVCSRQYKMASTLLFAAIPLRVRNEFAAQPRRVRDAFAVRPLRPATASKPLV